jgi:photosystem II stability/assembly factor-like uncharacterized protein
VIIGTLVSLSGRRLAATLVAMFVSVIAGLGVDAATLPDSTWVALSLPPQQGRSPMFALAVDPAHNQVLIAGDSRGSLLRSKDGGSSWAVVHAGRTPVITIAFNPLKPDQVLAGTRGSGALMSSDSGSTWAAVSGLDGRDVRVFGFALTLIAAGTDRGVYTSVDGNAWKQSGLSTVVIDALAVAAIHEPARLVAGSGTGSGSAGPALFQSIDAGSTWTSLNPPISGTAVAWLAAGPLPQTGNVRPLVVGTNAGLFISADNGSTFAPLSGGDLLPSTDYTQIAFVTTHHDRFYVASDGGGSRSGGLWWTGDSGRHFRTLIPPLPSVTALAVSNDEKPVLYVATFRAVDHAAALWAYHDTGATPKGPFGAVTPPASGGRTNSSPATGVWADFMRLLRSSQAPYVGLGGIAVLVIVLAMVSNLRARRR